MIPVVPDHKLSTIEGRNGIGKTLAARVLEFITGGQPFVALPMAWESFGRDLGKLTVTIDGFPGGEVVRCELDGATWKGRRESECVAEPGLAFINDRAAEWAEVHRLFKVRRIAGDEGLTETLARTLRESSVIARQRDEETSSIVDAFGDALQPLTDDLVHVRVAGHAKEAEEYQQLTMELDAASRKAEVARIKCVEFTESLAAHKRILESIQKLPALLNDYAIAVDAHAIAEKASEAADKKLTEIGRKQAIDATAAERINWLMGRRPHRLDQLARAQVDERRAHARLGTTVRLTPSQIRNRNKEIDERLESLAEENRSADMAGTVRNVQATILHELRSMPNRAQHERIATIGRDIRVHELVAGIDARRKQLEGIPKPNEVAERESIMANLKLERLWLGGLSELYRKTEQKRKLVDDGEAEIAQLRGSAGYGDELVEANEESAAARSNMMQAAVAVSEAWAGIKAALGLEQAPEELGNHDDSGTVNSQESEDEDSVTLNSELDVDSLLKTWLDAIEDAFDRRLLNRWTKVLRGPGPLGPRVGKAQIVVEQAVEFLTQERANADKTMRDTETAVSDLAGVQAHATDLLANRLERLGSALRSLSDPSGPWASYQGALKGVCSKCGMTWEAFVDIVERPPVLSDILEGQARASTIVKATRLVETVTQIADELETSAARVRDQWSNTANYLHKFSAELSARLEDSEYDAKSMRASAGDVLTSWAESTISDLLSTPELRSELFDESPTVAFNMKDHTVSWTDPATSRRRRRPLEAFSSGEQVFAYTKAKLERLGGLRNTTANVVVFLDEFGAFVARDRFAQLVTYIQHDALGRIADQIVVTVPLSGELGQVRDRAALAQVEAEVVDPPGYIVIPARVD